MLSHPSPTEVVFMKKLIYDEIGFLEVFVASTKVEDSNYNH